MSLPSQRISDIEKQLAYLQWAKLRNERAIKQSLENSKIAKEKDTIMKVLSETAPMKNSWRADVLNDEFTKPLQLTNEQYWIIKYDRGQTSKGIRPQSPKLIKNSIISKPQQRSSDGNVAEDT